MGLPHPLEDVIPVPESNHSTVCKFDGRSQNYELVISGIAELVKWSLTEVPASDTVSIRRPTSWTTLESDKSVDSDLISPLGDLGLSYAYLPDFSRSDLSHIKVIKTPTTSSEPLYLWPSLASDHFTGRNELMKSIQEALLVARAAQTRLALHGLGGVGKTQIALQIIRWYRSHFPNESIFWIHGGSADMLQRSLTEIALRRRLLDGGDISTEPLDAVRNFLLNESNPRWLMVVDNVDDPEAFFKPLPTTIEKPQTSYQSQNVPLGTYIPRCSHGRVGFTTNSKALGERLTMQGFVIEVPHLNLGEACALLQQRLFEDMDSVESPPSYRRETPKRENLEKLCGYLDCLPLALSQAAAFMRQQNVTVAEYIQLLDADESRISDLLVRNFQTSGQDYEFTKAIEGTWNVTFDRIATDVPIAADLLSLMAFLDSKNIPKSLLRSLVSDEWDLTVNGLGTLQSYALVNHASRNDTFSIHRLIQHAMRKRLASADATIKWSRKALSILSEVFPDGGHESWETCAGLIPHALQVLKIDRLRKTEDLLSVATLQFKISQYYSNLGLFSQAAELSLETLDTLMQYPEAPKSLLYKTKNLRAHILKNHGDLQGAEDLAKEVWYERQHEFGAKHIDTLESYEVLALMYQEQGKLKEGARAARQVLKGLRKTTQGDELVVQSAKRRLGTILHKLGELSEAETFLREALEGYTGQLGPDESTTLKTKWRLAWILHDQGNYREAERMSSETWSAQKRIFGENHPDSLKSLYLYADDLHAQSKFEEAVTLKRHVHVQAVALIGPKHRYTLLAASSLASSLIASVQREKHPVAYEEASKLYNAAWKGLEESLLPDHPETLIARTNLSNMLRLEGSFQEAETFERETLKKAKTGLEKHHPIVLDSREQLAQILWAQNESKAKSKEAVEQIHKVLKVKEKRYGWNFGGTRNTARLIIGMLPDGKEKEKLRNKIAKNDTLDDGGGTVEQSLGEIRDKSSGKSVSSNSIGGSYVDLDKKNVGHLGGA